MKTVTQNFLDAQKQPSPVYVRQLWYKRRYWVESSKTYVWETNWTQYTEDKVVDVSDITWQLDIQTLNEFKTSNVTVTLDNLRNQWNPENPYGMFLKDAGSPSYGYEAYWTKFQIRAGLQFGSTETTEVVPVFTGVATDYNVDSETGAMQITLTGEEALLIGANAEAVSTTVTNETLTGTVNGSNTIFTTAHNGVGIFTDISDNGTSKRQGTDVTLSQLNDPSNPGKVTFLVAPAAGHTIRGSYIYWNASQKFETLVTSLLNQAGIPGGNQQVSPVIFASNIINTHTWQTTADWAVGTSLTAIDTTTLPNSIKVDFNNSSGQAVATGYGGSLSHWTQAHTGTAFWLESPAGVDIEFTGGSVNGVTTYGSLYASQGNSVGGWRFSSTAANAGNMNANFAIYYFFMASSISTANGVNTGTLGYSIGLNIAGNRNKISLLKHSNSSGDPTANATVLGTYTPAVDTNTHDYVIVRYPSGRMIVYYDGVSIIDTTDTTYTAAGFVCLYLISPDRNAGGGLNNHDFGILGSGSFGETIYFPANTITGTWISGAVDFGSTPNAWTQFLHSETLNGGTVSYFTASSADNITYDSFLAVPSNGQIASTLRRYLKVKAILVSTTASNQDPTTSTITVGSITASTVITLANFTGMTCYDAITALANFANYEFGFDASENFFFRPKSSGSSAVFSFTESDFGLRVVQKVPGYDRVYSKIRATYAGYIKDITDDGLMYLDPLPRFGYNLLDINGGNILISSDADVATGIAGSFFAYYRLPRRRVKIQTRILQQLDISDVVNATFQDLQPTRWYVGDTSTYIGDSSKTLYGPDEQVLPPLNMKVVGMRINTNDWLTEFDLEEVI